MKGKVPLHPVFDNGVDNYFERHGLIDRIVADLKDKIIKGELKDGDLLPSQSELSRIMGVSKASLREALNRLSSLGFIVIKQGIGTFVKKPNSEDYITFLSSMLIMDQSSIEELLEAWLHIESVATLLAAKNRTEKDVAELSEFLMKQESALKTDSVAEFIEADIGFHMAVENMCKNRVLIKIISNIREVMKKFFEKFFSVNALDLSVAYEHHRKIFEAIRQGKSTVASKRMTDHMNKVLEIAKAMDFWSGQEEKNIKST